MSEALTEDKLSDSGMSGEAKSRSWTSPESPSPAAGFALEVWVPGEEASSQSGGGSEADGRDAGGAEGACTCVLEVQCCAVEVQRSVSQAGRSSSGVQFGERGELPPSLPLL